MAADVLVDVAASVIHAKATYDSHLIAKIGMVLAAILWINDRPQYYLDGFLFLQARNSGVCAIIVIKTS